MNIFLKIKRKIAKLQNRDIPPITFLVHCLQVFNPKLLIKNFPKDYFSIVTAIKNESFYIKEWLEFHKIVGVDRIYIYDNDSTDNIEEVLRPYIDEGFVVYIKMPGEIKQLPAFRHAIKHHGHKSFWMAFLDADEFLVPINSENIKTTMKEFENYPAIGVNWVVFDGNNHKTKPEGLVIENYTRVHAKKRDADLLIKTIAQPKFVYSTGETPHLFLLKNKKATFDENGNIIEGVYTKVHTSNKIRINHYCSKSLEEYEIKARRGCADHYGESKINLELFEFQDGVEDLTMQKYIEPIKTKLPLKKL